MMKVILNVSCALILISTFLFNTTDFFTNYIIMASQDKPFKRCNIYCRTKLNRKQTVVVDVRYSPSKPPTFLVMDQPCFPAYINDLPQYMIYNKFRLIADVSIIYRPIMIRSQSGYYVGKRLDYQLLKRKIISTTTYILNNRHLETLSSAKYLGITTYSQI
jgi:hypothetical protein